MPRSNPCYNKNMTFPDHNELSWVRGTQTQLKDGGIVLKINSKNISTNDFFVCELSRLVRKGEEGELLLSVGQSLTIVNHFHGVSSVRCLI